MHTHTQRDIVDIVVFFVENLTDSPQKLKEVCGRIDVLCKVVCKGPQSRARLVRVVTRPQHLRLLGALRSGENPNLGYLGIHLAHRGLRRDAGRGWTLLLQSPAGLRAWAG